MSGQRNETRQELVERFRRAFDVHNQKIRQMKFDKFVLLDDFNRAIQRAPFRQVPLPDGFMQEVLNVFFFFRAVWRGEVLTVKRLLWTIFIFAATLYFAYSKLK